MLFLLEIWYIATKRRGREFKGIWIYLRKKSNPAFTILAKQPYIQSFFISDIIPITDEYIDRPLINLYAKRAHIIKNKTLIAEIERKALRILAYEKNYPNYFRQNITATKNALIKELKESKKSQ